MVTEFCYTIGLNKYIAFISCEFLLQGILACDSLSCLLLLSHIFRSVKQLYTLGAFLWVVIGSLCLFCGIQRNYKPAYDKTSVLVQPNKLPY